MDEKTIMTRNTTYLMTPSGDCQPTEEHIRAVSEAVSRIYEDAMKKVLFIGQGPRPIKPLPLKHGRSLFDISGP